MKLLFITSRFPHPLEKGDKLRVYYHLKELHKHFDIYLMALCQDRPAPQSIETVRAVCKDVICYYESKWRSICRLFVPSNKPFQLKYFKSSGFHKQLRAAVKTINPDHIHFHLIRTADFLLDIQPTASLDLMDSFSLGLSSMRQTKALWKQPIYKLEERLVKRYEQKCLTRFDQCFIISERDRKSIDPDDRYHIQCLKNGIDLDFFNPRQPIKELNQSYDVMFVGNLGYAPNTEAVKYIIALAKRNPSILFGIAGARAQAVTSFDYPTNVHVLGWVEDIRSAYRAGTLFLAPVFHGSGLQNKLLEAMAMSRCCITTSFVNDALQAEHQKEIIIADGPESIEQNIHFYLNNPIKRDELASAGAAFVNKHFAWQAKTEPLINYICTKDKDGNSLERDTNQI